MKFFLTGMKKIYCISILVVCFLLSNLQYAKCQVGCNMALIRSTFTGAGCTELNACTSGCSIYFYNPISQSGDNAQAWAQTYGANLISIQSAAENNCIANDLVAHSFSGTIWIGFNDIASEGSFVWYDQSPVVYTNWNGGEPNNSGNEDCVQIYPNGMWNDLNCSSGGSSSVIEVNLCPVITITPSATTVCAGQNANLVASTILGSFPYTYSWTSVPAGFTSTSASPTFTPTVTTTFNVTSTDRYGCTSTNSAVVTARALPTATISGTLTTCKNASPPNITFTGASGTAPYIFTYKVNGGANQTVSTSGGSSVVAISVPTGTVGSTTYSLVSVQESSSTNCSQTQSGTATITVNPLPTGTIAGTATVCNFDAIVPDIVFTGSGGSTPYTFNYTINGGANQTITSPPGNTVATMPIPTSNTGVFVYNLTSVSDSLGCSQTQTGSITVTVNPLPTATIAGTTSVCLGSASPNITFTGAVGTAPYTFTYNINGGASQTITTTGGNSKTLAVPTTTAGVFKYHLLNGSDASNPACSKTLNDSATVIVNPLPTATLAGTITVCANDPAPMITFTGAGGTMPYTFNYNIDGGANQVLTTTGGSSIATASAPTNTPGMFMYEISSVSDNTTCSQLQTAMVHITVNALPTATINGTTAVCVGATSPTINFTGAAGTAPYTFTYKINGGINQTINTLGGSSTVTIAAPTTTSGVYTYSLSSVQDASITVCSQAQTGSATITVNPLPTATIAGTTAVCKNSAAPNITFTGAAGTAPYIFTYKINGGANQTVSSIGGSSVATMSAPTTTAGTFVYTLVSVKDGSTTTCSQIQNGTATITVNPLPTATISGTTAVCKNDSPPTITFAGSSGTAPYTITYKINGGTNQTVVTSGNNATVSVPTSITGAFTYALVSIMDSSSTTCSQVQNGSATVTVNPLPIATIAGTTTVCKNDTAPTLTLRGAAGTAPYTITYTINGGTNQTVVTNAGDSATLAVPTTTAGTFIYDLVSVQDASTTVCSQQQSGAATVIVNPLPTAIISGTIAVCANDIAPNITFKGSGSTAPYTITYTINGGSNQTISTLAGDSAVIAAPTGVVGTFTYALVSVHDAASTTCSQQQTGSAVVTVNPMPVATIAGTTTLCKNDTAPNIVFTGTSGTMPFTFTYSINGGANQTISTTSIDSVATLPVSTATAGTFVYALLNVHDASSTVCSQAQNGTATIVVNPLPTASISGSVSVCKDDTPPLITFTGGGSTAPYTITYTVNGANQTITTNGGNSATVFVPTTITGSYNYSLISVQDSSSTACSQAQTGSATVTVNPYPLVAFGVNKKVGCEQLCITFQDSSSIATGVNAHWLWNFGDGSASSSLQSDLIHCYSNDSVFAPMVFTPVLTVTSDSGCVTTITKIDYITVYPKPIADFTASPGTTSIIDPVISIVNLSTGANFWSWNFGDPDTSSSVNPLAHTYTDSGKYVITLITSTQFGCADTAHQTIVIEPDFEFFIPNAFTPNDDGINDTFSGKGIFITKYEMMIYDRWGNLVFFSTDINKPWTGKANLGDHIAQADVYVYKIKLTDINTREHAYKGIVKLVR